MEFIIKKLDRVLLLALALIFLLPLNAKASMTDGVIDSAYKYAWGENIGWINFKAANSNVVITDDGLSGYGWSANYGWINLAPTTAGVTNDGSGDLSGHAWGANLGWIDFSAVSINSSGEFAGYAIIENNNSRISFNCSNTSSCASSDFKLKTDWRPRSARPACNNSSDDDGDGKTDYPADPGCSSLEDTDETDEGGGGAVVPFFSNIISSAQVEKIQEIISELPKKLVETVKPIIEAPAKEIQPTVEPVKPVSRKIVSRQLSPLELVMGKLKELFKPILSKLAKLTELKPPEIPVEKLVPQKTPLAMRGQWQLLPKEPINKFVLAPLPQELLRLAQKFSSLGKTFQEVNITKVVDIARLSAVALTLPGLTEAAGLSAAETKTKELAWPEGLPLASLSAAVKAKLPSEIVFARFGGVSDPTGRRPGGKLIDYNIDLTINEQGRPQQKITALANQMLELVVKPEGKVNAVKGYLVFKSTGKEQSRQNKPLSGGLIRPALAKEMEETSGASAPEATFSSRLKDFLSSLIFARPSLAFPQTQPVPVEEKLVLQEFDYTDPDNDGLWTARIKTPATEGEYEIITVLYYQDPELGARAIKLTTVIDPEGYVYEQYGDKEIRVPGAVVSLYYLNPATKEYQVWPASDYNQKNPQVTDVSGKYSFLVPAGFYYLKIAGPGYLSYEGKSFQVAAGGNVHFNVELKTKYWWLKTFDWKMILLIVVILLLLYNFYRDKIRERLIKLKN